MFRKIVVAFNESPESQRAFLVALKLAKSLNAEFLAVTAIGELPAYTAFAGVADSSISRVLEEDRRDFYAKLQDHARAQVESSGIGFHSHLVEGRQVEAIVDFLRQQKADLLVIGLHQRDLYIARLWSTVLRAGAGCPLQCSGRALNLSAARPDYILISWSYWKHVKTSVDRSGGGVSGRCRAPVHHQGVLDLVGGRTRGAANG